MANKKEKSAAEHIQPLVMNGLEGRMLRVPATGKKAREILLIYGQHSSIERTASLAEEFSRYGTVTVPDLPGFGGMEPMYKLREKPDLDMMADYLAAFVRLMYNRKRVTIIGISYGFIVATRMLQRYPELVRKTDLLISIVGFMHYEDFLFTPRTLRLMRVTSRFFSFSVPAWFARHVLLLPVFIRTTYKIVENKHAKLKDASAAERQRRIDFEIVLWRQNDIRTYMATIHDMLYADLCAPPVKLPVYHVSVDGDQYFDNYKVEQHMRVAFEDFTHYPAKLGAHMPTIVADRKEVAPLIPTGLRRLLSKQ